MTLLNFKSTIVGALNQSLNTASPLKFYRYRQRLPARLPACWRVARVVRVPKYAIAPFAPAMGNEAMCLQIIRGMQTFVLC